MIGEDFEILFWLQEMREKKIDDHSFNLRGLIRTMLHIFPCTKWYCFSKGELGWYRELEFRNLDRKWQKLRLAQRVFY